MRGRNSYATSFLTRSTSAKTTQGKKWLNNLDLDGKGVPSDLYPVGAWNLFLEIFEEERLHSPDE